MKVYAASYTMTKFEMFNVAPMAANITSDPFGSPVYQLRSLLGV